MSDAVKVALINKIPDILLALGVIGTTVLGFVVKNKVDGTASRMETKVDGLTETVLALTAKTSFHDGQDEQRDKEKL
jgi:hypothetical protein